MSVVLVPIDGSARALRAVPWAARLAGPGGTVALIRVIPPEPAYAEALLTLAGSGEDGVQRIREQWVAVAQADMDEAAEMLAGAGVTIERLILEGEPEDAIVAAADERGVDLIVMASHGRGAIGRAIFGSVADRVTRTATVPVLVLRTPADEITHDEPVRRIVVPLDGSALAAEALPVAAKLARTLNVPAYVVRAIDPVASVPVARGNFGVSPMISAEIAERIWDEAESEAQTTVSEAVARLQQEGIAASGATLSGSPYFAISDATEPGDLLVLTSHGRGGVRRWLLGSVAEKLVREAPAPVLLVPASARRGEESGSREVGES